MGIASEIEIQRRHFAETACNYHSQFVYEGDEHSFALAFLVAVIEHFKFESVLDIGPVQAEQFFLSRTHYLNCDIGD